MSPCSAASCAPAACPGSFDWQRVCVIDQPATSSNTYACRLGFFGSTVTGRAWCDNMSLLPLNSAFD